MNLGIISDIHGNFYKLQNALALLQEQNADQIVCAGDAVESGKAKNDAVIKLLLDNNIPCVRGNHEDYTLEVQEWLHPDSDKRLNSETLEFLKTVPDTLQFEWEGVKLAMAHGTRWALFPSSKPKYFQLAAESVNADVLITGHTHVPLWVKIGKTMICNPGAVYKDRCAMLSLPECELMLFDTGKQETVAINLNMLS